MVYFNPQEYKIVNEVLSDGKLGKQILKCDKNSLLVVPEVSESQEEDSAYFDSKVWPKVNNDRSKLKFGLNLKDSGILVYQEDLVKISHRLREIIEEDSYNEECKNNQSSRQGGNNLKSFTQLFSNNRIDQLRMDIKLGKQRKEAKKRHNFNSDESKDKPSKSLIQSSNSSQNINNSYSNSNNPNKHTFFQFEDSELDNLGLCGTSQNISKLATKDPHQNIRNINSQSKREEESDSKWNYAEFGQILSITGRMNP